MPVALFALALLAPPSRRRYLGLYLQGQKIGYVASKVAPGKLDGVSLSAQRQQDRHGHGPPRDAAEDGHRLVDLVHEGPARADDVPAGEHGAGAVDGRAVRGRQGADLGRQLGPEDAEDPPDAERARRGRPAHASSRRRASRRTKFWVLDPTTVSFKENSIRLIGPSKVDVKGKTVAATLAEVIDPQRDDEDLRGRQGRAREGGGADGDRDGARVEGASR